MNANACLIHENEMHLLRILSARIGNDLQLTQASTGNCSIKLNGVLWIKASGKWMADALNDEFLIPLDLSGVRECFRRNMDPAKRFAGASIETAMHAVLPHRVVLHLHSVNALAWAVRTDAPVQLENRLAGLPWQWIRYAASGLPLAREIALTATSGDGIYVLGNHGLVIGSENCEGAERLLGEVEQRLAVPPRRPGRPDFSALVKIANGQCWTMPADDEVHALGNDTATRKLLEGGFLYPCQSILANSSTRELFCAVPCLDDGDQWESRYKERPFLIIEGRGVVVSKKITATQQAILSGLAKVVQRIAMPAPIHYLTETEVAESFGDSASHYVQATGGGQRGAF